jgi:hypothetical protein
MPNGHQGSRADWLRLEAPLLELDPVLSEFARIRGLSISKNYHDWPERSLVWGSGVRRLIQLYLQDSETLRFNLWLCASQDRGSSRFWKKDFLFERRLMDEFRPQLFALLDEGYALVNSWDSSMFELAGKVQG